MSDLDEMTQRVEAVIQKGVIAPMNMLLVELGEDAGLSQETRYALQQKLRIAITHRDRHARVSTTGKK